MHFYCVNVWTLVQKSVRGISVAIGAAVSAPPSRRWLFWRWDFLALGHFVTGVSAQCWKVTVTDPVHLLCPYHMPAGTLICPAGGDARIVDATWSKESE